ncbi:hypothetical protein MPTK1_7g19600 [Marchantia polymorpha subsp. ruderalis]|uniref:Uncharacterized protein n=2 Tax=Marchantia polymorpha TaxID=3197 RepID=A0AAF6C1H6_MARPO|nr:hypothetical protein MARPO_0067s0017 [Marchantia polymorpha]BBN18110.1 hypothetical protein Mp_7g19600 [Marchantia polymorpha subsp. ruderalis]|eukprot:PTQ35923.1 hypothetical protein MARPO_0067s0017 [Marchantia polymorpha]
MGILRIEIGTVVCWCGSLISTSTSTSSSAPRSVAAQLTEQEQQQESQQEKEEEVRGRGVPAAVAEVESRGPRRLRREKREREREGGREGERKTRKLFTQELAIEVIAGGSDLPSTFSSVRSDLQHHLVPCRPLDRSRPLLPNGRSRTSVTY